MRNCYNNSHNNDNNNNNNNNNNSNVILYWYLRLINKGVRLRK